MAIIVMFLVEGFVYSVISPTVVRPGTLFSTILLF